MPEDLEPRKRPLTSLRQLSLAMELPFVMVAGIVIGGGIGYFLDRWLHISPALTLTGGALGFAWGMWDILRRLSRERNQESGRGGG
ncbi:MAG: AtpZ/AtpI family protein [Candidatus Acidiferrales bacterium]